MELIYGYIDDYRGFIKEREFRFSNDFDVKFDKNKKELKIIEKENKSIENFFSKDIININLVVGKNGVGKTTLIDLLGAKGRDRDVAFSDFFYFFLYRIKKNMYVIEGNEPRLNNMNNLFKKNPKGNDKIKNPFSVKFVTEKESLVFKDYPNWDNENTSNKLIYLNIRNEYNKRYSRKLIIFNKVDHSYLFCRYNSYSTGLEKKFRYLYIFSNLENHEYGKFYNKNSKLKIKFKMFDYYYIQKKYGKRRPRKKKTNYTNKQVYIIGFLNMYINEFLENNTEKSKESNLFKEKGCNFEDNKNILINTIKEVTKKLIKVNRIDDFIAKVREEKVLEFVYLLELIDEVFFTDDGVLLELKNKKLKVYFDKVIRLLRFMDSIILDIDFMKWFKELLGNEIEFKNLSEGEMVYLDLFTKIWESLNINEMKSKETAIILLDEPDKSFHPEWSRRFIYTLIKELENIKKVEKLDNLKFQIIISTHSPFMMSDLPKENIIFMQRDDLLKEDNENKINCKEDVKTFGNNIHTILNDKFFLDSTFGEFAKQKIANCLKDLNSEDYFDEIRKKEINYIINSIGEPFLKSELERLRDLKFNKEKESKIKEILEKNNDELEASDIEFMRSQLKNNIR